MKKPMTISEARAKFPELAKKVSGAPGAVEYIQHRDLPDLLVLTSASHLTYLETTISELKKKLGAPFKLRGSISSDLSDDELEEALGAIRQESSLQAEKKFADLGR